MRTINAVSFVTPFAARRVADLGDCWIEEPYALEGALGEIARFFHAVRAAKVTTLAVGGDHSVSLPILRAVAAEGPLGMVHIDAHCDTGDDYLGSRFHHGAPFRRAVEENLLDPKRVIQIGIRGTVNDRNMWGFSRESGMRVLPMEEFHDEGWRFALAEAKRVIGEGPTYLSFDIDSLDPVYAPGTGTPEAGGMTTLEAMRLLRGLTGGNFVGADLVEVSPPFDQGNITSLHGASILFELLCLLAASPALEGQELGAARPFRMQLEAAGISWKVCQEIWPGLAVAESEGWTSIPFIGDFGDTSVLCFLQYQNAAPGSPLCEKARSRRAV